MVALKATEFYSADQRIKSNREEIKTSFDIKGDYSSFLPFRNQQTEILEDYQSFHVIACESERVIQENPTAELKPKKNQANGAVLEVDEVLVKCEIYSDGQNRIVNLSKTLFKDRLYIGMPITVFLDETSGYKRLLVKDRGINEELRQQGTDEMASLVNEL